MTMVDAPLFANPLSETGYCYFIQYCKEEIFFSTELVTCFQLSVAEFLGIAHTRHAYSCLATHYHMLAFIFLQHFESKDCERLILVPVSYIYVFIGIYVGSH